MSPELWPQVKRLFDDLVDSPAAEREAALATAGLDAAVIAEVRSLFDASARAGDFLDETPCLEAGAEQVHYRSLAFGSVVGPFRVEGLVGRGGHGEVYLAQRADGQFDQRVALKLLRVEALSQFDNFHNERQILAGLEHPGIARLIEGGLSPDGRPYMAMEFVEGEDIQSYASRLKLDIRARIGLMLQVQAAVAYAHRNLVVHRDLKPGNILVTAEGRIKLLDFGIARLVDTDAQAGERTVAISTPAYAAPEQLEGLRATAATDIYALGAILFELMAGSSPWQTGSFSFSFASRILRDEPGAASAAAQTRQSPPVPPALLRGDIDAIIAKTLRRSPEDRYGTVEALSDDLRRYLDVRPVLARKGSSVYRIRRFVRRNALALSAAAVITVTAIAGAAGIAWQMREASIGRETARIEATRGETARDYMTLLFRSTADGMGQGPVTPRRILDMTARELEKEAAAGKVQPRLFSGLGELYFEMDEFNAAAPFLDHYAGLVAASGDAPELARARQMQAAIATRRGDYQKALELLDQAEAFWTANPGRYLREQAEFKGFKAAYLRETGKRDEALALLDQALLEISATLGADSIDATALRQNLGVHLLEGGQTERAAQVFAEVQSTLAAQGRLNSPTAITLQAHQALLAVQSGKMDDAYRLWEDAIQRRRQLYGASDALASIELGYARVLLSTGEPAKALPLLDEALSISQRSAGDSGVIHNIILQSRGLAQLMLGDIDAGGRDIEQAALLAEKSLGANSIYYGMALMARADLRMLRTDIAGAKADATAAAAIFDAGGEAAKAQQVALRQMLSTIAEAEKAHSASDIAR